MKYNGHGFIAPEITQDHFVAGDLGARFNTEIINPRGNWVNIARIIDREVQRKYGVETWNCTSFGTLSALEMVIYKLYGTIKNFCDRALGIIAGTMPYRGNSPHIVAEFLRKIGVPREEVLPFDRSIKTVEQYYQPKPLPSEILHAAKVEFLDVYNFGHEWVYPTWLSLPQKQEKIIRALERSVVAASVYANYRARTNKDGLIYKKPGDQDNHWIDIVGYDYGKCWYIYDSYEKLIKKFVWNYNFSFAKEYYIRKKSPIYVVKYPGVVDGKRFEPGDKLNFWEYWRAIFYRITKKIGFKK